MTEYRITYYCENAVKKRRANMFISIWHGSVFRLCKLAPLLINYLLSILNLASRDFCNPESKRNVRVGSGIVGSWDVAVEQRLNQF